MSLVWFDPAILQVVSRLIRVLNSEVRSSISAPVTDIGNETNNPKGLQQPNRLHGEKPFS